jgi:hypothetical protein
MNENIDDILNKKLPIQRFNHFLIKSFFLKHNKYTYPTKNPLFYKCLITGFHKWSDTVKIIINNIDSFGTYSDYLYLFKFNDGVNYSIDLEEYLINTIISKINEDIIKMKNGHKITLLSKHLPSESSSWQKKHYIVTKIATKMFPDAKDRDNAHRSYRKLITSLNRYNKLPEECLSKNEFEKINADGMNHHFINRNITKILKHDKLTNDLVDKYYFRYSSMNLYEFIFDITKYKLNTIQEMAINKLWKHKMNDFFNSLIISLNIKKNDVILLNIGSETSNSKKKNIILIVGYLLVKNNYNVYINNHVLTKITDEMFSDELTTILNELSLILSNLDDINEKIFTIEKDKNIYMLSTTKISSSNPKFKNIQFLFSNDNQLNTLPNNIILNMNFVYYKNKFLYNLIQLLKTSPDLIKENHKKIELRFKYSSYITIFIIVMIYIIKYINMFNSLI